MVYEQRRRARGPLGYAVRWGVEKVRGEHDKKKWMEQQQQVQGQGQVDGVVVGRGGEGRQVEGVVRVVQRHEGDGYGDGDGGRRGGEEKI